MIGIKGAKMPKRCAECKFCVRQKTNDYGSYGQCMAQDCETVNTLNWSLPPSCPLVEIITCKDCDNRCTGGLCTKHNITVTKDFYCKDGIRKE